MAGVPAPPPPGPPRDASAVVLWRPLRQAQGERGPAQGERSGGVEVFWLKRGERLNFFGGFFAFPGGKVDKADALISIARASGKDAALKVAAARELFEETGVLVARGAEKLSQAQLDEARKALLDGTLPFAHFLAREGLTLDAADFPEAGRWLTPPFLQVRFDARFYLVEAPAQQKAEVWPGELSYGAWVTPAEALAKWAQGQALLHPPNLHALQVMERFTTAAAARAEMQSPPHCHDFVAERLEFQRGVRLFPLPTPTLPPATHTTTYLLGTGELLVVDPGAPDEVEIDRLAALLADLAAEGLQPRAIVLTHHHGDHVGGAALLAKRTGLPVWAHPLTADRLPLSVARLLNDGDVLTLAGPQPMRWRVLHTPGHARGHICLFDEASKAAVVGDMIAGVGTIVIDPPEGDMAEYLRQLQRLKDTGVRTLFPAHGPAISDGAAKVDEYLQHRAWREGKVLGALQAGAAPVDQLVARAYDDVQSFVWPIAERNTLAILLKLKADGRASETGGVWAVG
jgi:endoribonuclease LACTB2